MKISVITINYNNKSGLERTIRSVAGQTYPNLEYVVIDGGSGDGSTDVIRQYQDKISYWVSEPDKGIYNAMNKGILKATGDYLLFLNSGDEFYNSSALKNLAAETPETDFVYGNLAFAEGHKVRILEYPGQLRFSFFIHQSLPHPSCLIRRSCFDKVGLYDEALKIVSDWKFFLLAICRHDCSYRHRAVTVSTFYNDGVSSDPANTEKVRKEKEGVLKTCFTPFIEDCEELLASRKKLHRLRYLNPVNLVRRLAGIS